MNKARIVAWVAGFLLTAGLGTYARAAAPCSALGWLPTKDIPARCLIWSK